MGVAGRARASPRADRGSAAARSPQARRRAGPVQLPRRNRFGPAGLPPQGWHRPPRTRGLLAAQAHRGGLRVRQHPAHHQGRSCSTPRGTSTGTPTACSRPMHIDAEFNEDGTVRKPGQDYYLKPMNCPMHCLIFRARGRSYRELPLRALRVRHRLPLREVRRGARVDPGARPDDGRRAHLLHPRPDARRADVAADVHPRPARRLRPRPTSTSNCRPRTPKKFVGSDEIWEEATDTLAEVGCRVGSGPGARSRWRRVLRTRRSRCRREDALGRSWQMSTIQLDFNFPERFELEYTAADGTRQRPVMIHRALFGSIERFFGILTEHYAGAFPAWLAPVQVVGIPVADEPRRRTWKTVAEQLKVAWYPRRGRRQRRPDGQEDRQPHQPEGAVHAAGRRPRRRGAS